MAGPSQELWGPDAHLDSTLKRKGWEPLPCISQDLGLVIDPHMEILGTGKEDRPVENEKLPSHDAHWVGSPRADPAGLMTLLLPAVTLPPRGCRNRSPKGDETRAAAQPMSPHTHPEPNAAKQADATKAICTRPGSQS